MATNIQEIFGLQENILINLVQENLRNCAFVWKKISPTIFQTQSMLINGSPWDVRVGKTATPSGFKYYIEVLKCSDIVVTVTSSVNPEVEGVFDTAEEMFSPLKDIEDEAISVLDDCRCTLKFRNNGEGGVVVGGEAVIYQPQRIFEVMDGGVVIGGISLLRVPERYFEVGEGGAVIGGCADYDSTGFRPPSVGEKVQFSGVFIGDYLNCADCVHQFDSTSGCCGTTTIQDFSEIVGGGFTDDAESILPNAHRTTFDSMAIWPDTRIIIKTQQTNATIIDITGPALIYNRLWRVGQYGAALSNLLTKTLVGTDPTTGLSYETLFPPSARYWSDDSSLGVSITTQMQEWSKYPLGGSGQFTNITITGV